MYLGVTGNRLKSTTDPSVAARHGPRAMHAVWTPAEGDRYSSVWDPAVPAWSVRWRIAEAAYLKDRRAGQEAIDLSLGLAPGGTIQATVVSAPVGEVRAEYPAYLPPDQHLERMRALAATGWRPVAVAVVHGPGGPVASSVWHRRDAPE
jgi:hypothetical protein